MADKRITIELLDLVTGKRVVNSAFDADFWAKGGGSCDCYRLHVFNLEPSDVDPNWGDYDDHFICLGFHRFLVIAAIPDCGYPLHDFNKGYLVHTL